ncbi:MAG TPA: hypothetical protein VFN38_00445 [Gemmatimonadaceae bacterium]|nr:hypothetical protein [Gemmatimonadaceae bacterium]
MKPLTDSLDRLRPCGAALVLLLAACWTSPKPQQVAMSDQQRGASVTLRMTDGVVHSAELLSVRDGGLVLLLGQRVAVAPLAGVASLTFAPAGSPMNAADAKTLEHARGAARFPYGIPPAALTLLLRHAGQDAPIELHAGAP